MLILKNLEADIILGADFLQKFNAKLNFSNPSSFTLEKDNNSYSKRQKPSEKTFLRISHQKPGNTSSTKKIQDTTHKYHTEKNYEKASLKYINAKEKMNKEEPASCDTDKKGSDIIEAFQSLSINEKPDLESKTSTSESPRCVRNIKNHLGNN